jgi:hypothetical protein
MAKKKPATKTKSSTKKKAAPKPSASTAIIDETLREEAIDEAVLAALEGGEFLWERLHDAVDKKLTAKKLPPIGSGDELGDACTRLVVAEKIVHRHDGADADFYKLASVVETGDVPADAPADADASDAIDRDAAGSDDAPADESDDEDDEEDVDVGEPKLTRYLEHVFTPEELIALTDERDANDERIDELNLKILSKKDELKNLDQEVKGLESKNKSLSRARRKGSEWRNVECEERPNYELLRWETYRLDTNEMTGEPRPMTREERQGKLFEPHELLKPEKSNGSSTHTAHAVAP